MVTSPDAAQTQADETAEREANSRKADEGHGLTAATNHLTTLIQVQKTCHGGGRKKVPDELNAVRRPV